MYDENRQIPRLKRVLLIDSASASIGGLLGVSSVTSYIESAAGIAEGARTGAHTVIVGILFLVAVFLAPLAGIVPAAATAPALMLVGFLMCGQMTRVDFDQRDTAIPAFITLITIPYTYSIAHGIGYGFIAYVLIKLLTLRGARHSHPMLAVAAGMFLRVFCVCGMSRLASGNDPRSVLQDGLRDGRLPASKTRYAVATASWQLAATKFSTPVHGDRVRTSIPRYEISMWSAAELLELAGWHGGHARNGCAGFDDGSRGLMPLRESDSIQGWYQSAVKGRPGALRRGCFWAVRGRW